MLPTVEALLGVGLALAEGGDDAAGDGRGGPELGLEIHHLEDGGDGAGRKVTVSTRATRTTEPTWIRTSEPRGTGVPSTSVGLWEMLRRTKPSG